MRTATGSSSTTVYIAVPALPAYVDRGRVTRIMPGHGPKGHRHRWYEMDHYGQLGTGFAMCACGAIGDLADSVTVRQ